MNRLILCLQIEDYEPCHSIVITPGKMIKYYEDVKLPNEIYPWSGKCETHLIEIMYLINCISCLR